MRSASSSVPARPRAKAVKRLAVLADAVTVLTLFPRLVSPGKRLCDARPESVRIRSAFRSSRSQSIPRIFTFRFWQRIEDIVQSESIPDCAAVDSLGRRHAAIAYHLIEERSRDAQVTRRIYSGQAARDKGAFGRGSHDCLPAATLGNNARLSMLLFLKLIACPLRQAPSAAMLSSVR